MAAKEILSIDTVRREIDRIRRIADKEQALNAHRGLHRHVLHAISRGHPYPQQLANALMPQLINVPPIDPDPNSFIPGPIP